MGAVPNDSDIVSIVGFFLSGVPKQGSYISVSGFTRCKKLAALGAKSFLHHTIYLHSKF